MGYHLSIVGGTEFPLMENRRKTTTEKVVDKEERDLQIKRALEDFTD